MSADGFLANSETELLSTLLAALRGDTESVDLLGDPPRIFDGDAVSAIEPYIDVERFETTESSVSGMRGFEHLLQFAVHSRHGGLVEAKAILGALRQALEGLSLNLITQRVTLIIPTYCDVMRSKSAQTFRGVFRVRIHTEEI